MPIFPMAKRVLVTLPLFLVVVALLPPLLTIGCNGNDEVRVGIDDPAGTVIIDTSPQVITQGERTIVRVEFEPENGPVTIRDYQIVFEYDRDLLPVLQEVTIANGEEEFGDFVLEFNGTWDEPRLVLRLTHDVENLEGDLSALVPFVVDPGAQLDEDRDVRFNVVIRIAGNEVADEKSPSVTLKRTEREEPEESEEEEQNDEEE